MGVRRVGVRGRAQASMCRGVLMGVRGRGRVGRGQVCDGESGVGMGVRVRV